MTSRGCNSLFRAVEFVLSSNRSRRMKPVTR